MGQAWKFGDNIDTDQIIPSQYLVLPSIKDMARHTMEPQNPDFATQFKNGDIIVGEVNFGCGSSREQAPLVLKELGVRIIIALDFARIFFRNAINNGILPIEHECAKEISDKDDIVIDLKTGEIVNQTTQKTWYFNKIQGYLADILDAGGLAAYIASRKGKQT
ncbi:MAG: 3-isopropylmalate dehydratase small subunit [Candidatus Magnetoglobus multicellularis str. Araruama]|uniref:3-isopropylmalate dehydratase n=1 Tax=Candidatus Magnetoglobus multicellularis str. Araruama TaxID=890399 RepID=A0A1V1PBK9_9BACT|nr:MAG: 3-isopropylmalate dehydratase small subunit [Candidatus Magnetoglobus multicellularis str. Araruama]